MPRKKTSGNPRLCNPDGHDKPLTVPAAEFDVLRYNCVVTMENTNKGTHRTFMVRTIQEGETFGNPGDRVLAMLTGPDRSDPKNWRNLGFVSEERGIYLFRNIFQDAFFQTIRDMLINPVKWEAKGVAFLMMTFCRRCNRPLTVPASIKSGLGPICGDRAA